MDALDLYLIFCVTALAVALLFPDPRRPRDVQRQQRRANLLANGFTDEEADRLIR